MCSLARLASRTRFDGDRAVPRASPADRFVEVAMGDSGGVRRVPISVRDRGTAGEIRS